MKERVVKTVATLERAHAAVMELRARGMNADARDVQRMKDPPRTVNRYAVVVIEE